MRTLYGITMSPWTEKARWALDHHGVAYRYHEHVPLMGELLLRIKAKNARGRKPGEKASVPLLVDGDEVLPSSLAIARHADSIGKKDAARLFPDDLEKDVLEWAELSDRMINVGRAQILAGLCTNRDAQQESLPPFMPGPLRSVLAPSTATVAKFLVKKYDVPSDVDKMVADTMRPALEKVRKTKGDREYLLGRLTFADVAIASSLRAVKPEERAIMGTATRGLWTNPSLVEEYADLLAWRDALYRKHREPS